MATGFMKDSVPGGEIQETVFAHRFAKCLPISGNISEGLIPANLNDKLTGCGRSPYMKELNLVIITTFKRVVVFDIREKPVDRKGIK